MSNDTSMNQNDDEFIRRRLGDLLDAEEFAVFSERLVTDAEFRKRYVRHADLEASLYEELSRTAEGRAPYLNREPRRFAGVTFLGVVALAAAVVVFMAWQNSGTRPEDKNAEQQIAEPDLQRPAQPQAPVVPLAFTSTASARVHDAAVVVSVAGVVEADLIAGMRLKPGVLAFAAGQVQLEFMSGAVVVLAGPAELIIESKDAASLVKGMVSARVPDRARGFVLNAPDSAIVDLGTEFGVKVNPSGTSEVGVLSGEVQLSLLGDDGSTLLSRLVIESESVKVDSPHQKLTLMDRSEVQYPQITAVPCSPLPVSDAYVRSVLDNQPQMYWRFSDAEGEIVQNEVSERWAAAIHQPHGLGQGIFVLDGQVRFESAKAARYLMTAEPLPALNEDEYSIEFWMNPDSLNHTTCFGLFPASDPHALNHLNVIEIVTNTPHVHPPGAIRFLHRNPPSHAFELGTNVYTGGVCTPGRWQYVVAVKDATGLSMYFNGKLARRVDTIDPDGAGDFSVILGQLNTYDFRRQFVGYMDEVAVYPSALTPAVVQSHYQLMMIGMQK